MPIFRAKDSIGPFQMRVLKRLIRITQSHSPYRGYSRISPYFNFLLIGFMFSKGWNQKDCQGGVSRVFEATGKLRDAHYFAFSRSFWLDKVWHDHTTILQPFATQFVELTHFQVRNSCFQLESLKFNHRNLRKDVICDRYWRRNEKEKKNKKEENEKRS
mgnify:CR=1 FL=1